LSESSIEVNNGDSSGDDDQTTITACDNDIEYSEIIKDVFPL